MISYWLVKSEAAVYSIDDLKRDQKTGWDGIRNYQARNFMRDSMKKGDLVLFYHSSSEPTGVAGIARVSKEGYPEVDVWVKVDLEFVEKFTRVITLAEIKNVPSLSAMKVVQKGQRLSVQPVTKADYSTIIKMAHQ